jgi:hypothetical protein
MGRSYKEIYDSITVNWYGRDLSYHPDIGEIVRLRKTYKPWVEISSPRGQSVSTVSIFDLRRPKISEIEEELYPAKRRKIYRTARGEKCDQCGMRNNFESQRVMYEQVYISGRREGERKRILCRDCARRVEPQSVSLLHGVDEIEKYHPYWE